MIMKLKFFCFELNIFFLLTLINYYPNEHIDYKTVNYLIYKNLTTGVFITLTKLLDDMIKEKINVISFS
jgi:hypothetical protein